MNLAVVAAHACAQLALGASVGTLTDIIFGPVNKSASTPYIFLETMGQITLSTCAAYGLLHAQNFIEDPLSGIVLGYILFRSQKTLDGRAEELCQRWRSTGGLSESEAN